MAISVTNRTSLATTTNGLVYTTNAGGDGDGTFTPAAGSLLLAWAISTTTNGVPDSVTGHGVTWTMIADHVLPTGAGNFSLWAALAGATPTDTAVTVTYSGTNRGGCLIHVHEVTGVDVSGTAAQAIVQSPENNGTDTTGTVTLAAAGASGNRPVAGFGHAANEATTFRTNWSELNDNSQSAPNRSLETQWRSDTFETTASATWATSSEWVGIAAEIKAAISDQNVTAVTLTTSPTLPQASLTYVLTAAILTATPTQPAATLDTADDTRAIVTWVEFSLPVPATGDVIEAQALSVSAELPQPSLTLSIDAVTLEVTPVLPQASAQVASITAATLTITPELPTGELVEAQPDQVIAQPLLATPSLLAARIDHTLTAATLTVTPSLPQGEVAEAAADEVRPQPLTATPALPAARVDHTLTAATLSATPTLPQASAVSTDFVSAVTFTATPALPQASISRTLAAQPLSATPTLPQASVRADIGAAPLTVTPVMPAAFLTEPIGAVTLTVAPTIPFAELHHALTGQVLTTTPVLPSAMLIAGEPGRPVRGPTGATGTNPNRVLVGASANSARTQGPNDAEVT